MFTIDYVALEAPPQQVQLPCELAERKRHVCVRAVCCTSHEGMLGIDVHLGAVQAAATAAKTFRIDEVTYGVLVTKTTNAHGWACFPDASDHAAKTLAIWIEVADYHPEAAPEAPLVARAIDFHAQCHTVVTAVARSQIPLIPADFDATVAAMAEQMTKVRLLVDHGPNLGNQSAALSLLKNLRRAGFAGPIEALVDSYTQVEPWVMTLKLVGKVVNDASLGANIQGVFDGVEQKLQARYANTVVGVVAQSTTAKTITFTAPGRVFKLLPGENARLAQCFKDLPFPYRLTGEFWGIEPPTWPTFGDDAEEVDDEDDGSGEVARVDLAGTTAATEATSYLVTITVRFSLSTEGEASVDAKLKKLDPVYDGADTYPDVTWVKKSGAGILPAFDADLSATRTVVGMVAGGEFNEASVETYRKDKLKTYSIAAIQPLLWHPESRFYKLADRAVMKLCLPEAAAYFIDPVVAAVPLDLFRGQVEAGPAAAFAAIVAAAATGNFDLMVTYGVHQARSSSAAVVLDNLVRALSAGITATTLKKTILLVICKEGVDLPVVHAKVVRAGVDAALAGKIGALAADQILVVDTEPMPQRSFQLLAQKSTLPFLLEGANTCNMMQMLGKPYLSVCTETTPYVKVPGKNGEIALAALTAHLNGSGEDGRAARVEALAGYFGAAKEPDAVLDGYFPALAAHVKSKSLDQVKWTLYRLKKAFDAAPVASSEQCRPTS